MMMWLRSYGLPIGAVAGLSALVAASTTVDGTSYEIAWLQPVATWGGTGGNKIDYQLVFLPDKVRVKGPGLRDVGGCEAAGLEIPRNGEARHQSSDAATKVTIAYAIDGSTHRITLATTARPPNAAEHTEVSRLDLKLDGNSCRLVSYTRGDTLAPSENLAGEFHYRCVPFPLPAFEEGRSCEE
ncbi:MAG: hypothetical protein NTV97_06425 [Alphaproteobacteria bacterium]|nr:hypothetical protein [Alphaproteobacteria bacterium]